MPSLSEILFGQKSSIQQQSTQNPQQQAMQSQLMQLLAPLLGQGGDYLSGLFDMSSEGQDAFAAPFMRQFEEQTIPGIAERFTAMDGQRSGAFGQQLGQAGAGLQENLASLQGQLSQSGLNSLMQLLQQSMSPSLENIYKPGSSGLLGGLLGGVGQAAGTGLGGSMGRGFGNLGQSGYNYLGGLLK
jgi:hypothetical protein